MRQGHPSSQQIFTVKWKYRGKKVLWRWTLVRCPGVSGLTAWVSPSLSGGEVDMAVYNLIFWGIGMLSDSPTAHLQPCSGWQWRMRVLWERTAGFYAPTNACILPCQRECLWMCLSVCLYTYLARLYTYRPTLVKCVPARVLVMCLLMLTAVSCTHAYVFNQMAKLSSDMFIPEFM